MLNDPTKCPKCKGNGYTKQNKEITFDIPKGIAHGQSLRKRGFGGPGKNGGGNGDLYGLISVMPSSIFTRDGDDIYVTVEISMIDAALGAEIVIPTIDGDEKYTVKAGTQPNDMVTLRGKGSYNSQLIFGQMAVERVNEQEKLINNRVFIPEKGIEEV